MKAIYKYKVAANGPTKLKAKVLQWCGVRFDRRDNSVVVYGIHHSEWPEHEYEFVSVMTGEPLPEGGSHYLGQCENNGIVVHVLLVAERPTKSAR